MFQNKRQASHCQLFCKAHHNTMKSLRSITVLKDYWENYSLNKDIILTIFTNSSGSFLMFFFLDAGTSCKMGATAPSASDIEGMVSVECGAT